MQYALTTESLTKRFGARTAVDAVSLKIPRGSVYGLVGPNGAGKTTLMRALLGFTQPTSGSASVLGHPMPSSSRDVYPKIGVIIEEPHFFDFLTGRENLEQVAVVRGNITRAQIDAALDKVEMTERASDRVKTYSLGMRQRLGIARAILHDPELLILDEPSNGLDPPGIRDMRLLLRGLASAGKTVFVSSHILAEMEQMCDHVAVLKDGAVIADGPIGQVTGGGTTAGSVSVFIRLSEDRLATARELLRTTEGVTSVGDGNLRDSLVVAVDDSDGARAAARVNRRLVEAGLDVYGVGQQVATLEQRFMDIVGEGGTP